MSNEVAIFLDLDNLVIGAKQAELSFDIELILEAIKKLTGGRVVLRQAYGAGRQSQPLLEALATAGFEVHSATRINSFSKNLADMQIAVSAMETLVDGLDYGTYVFLSGDRDFTPLVQTLRKRGKTVIGIGVRHTTSASLAELCDQYIYYEDLLRLDALAEPELEPLLVAARDALLRERERVPASQFKQQLLSLDNGAFSQSSYAEGSFSKLLRRYPHLLAVIQEGTTTYVAMPAAPQVDTPLHLQYRTALKKQRLRVVPPVERFAILRETINALCEDRSWVWGELAGAVTEKLASGPDSCSKTQANALLLVAREAGVLRTSKGRSLPSAPVHLQLDGDHHFQEAVIRCDRTYLQAILSLTLPFDLEETAVALYDSPAYAPYLGRLARS